MRSLRVAVLSGGPSPEREPSLVSGAAICEGLASAGHVPVPIDVGIDRVWRRDDEPMVLARGMGLAGADVAFPMLHGCFGEDGTVQGMLEYLGLPYVGAGVLASALCLDKVAFKDLLAHAGLPQTRYETVTREAFTSDRLGVLERVAGFGLPAFVKPSACGSSIGISRVISEPGMRDALQLALSYGPEAIVEEGVGGIEVECSVIGNARPFVSRTGEIEVVSSRSGWRDELTKATRGSIRLKSPARVPEPIDEEIRALALDVYRLTHCRGLARVDFFVDGDRVLVNEVNTMPGMKPTSIFSLLLNGSGLPYREMLDELLRLALEAASTSAQTPVDARVAV
jgi:D-alanine-D-alanine ligase